MATYEKNKKYAKKYLTKFDTITIRSPREAGLREMIKTHTSSRGESLNEFILRAIDETIQRDLHPGNDMDDGIDPSFLEYELTRGQQ